MRNEALYPMESIYQQEQETIGIISSEIENILGELEVDTVLEQVQEEWGEGELMEVDYPDSGFPDRIVHDYRLKKMNVGVTLEANIPAVTASYNRQVIGVGHHRPVECMPGHSHSDGMHYIYGNGWVLKGARVEKHHTNLDVLVRPVFGNGLIRRARGYTEPELKDPKKYLVTVANFHLPNTRTALSRRDMELIDLKDGEIPLFNGAETYAEIMYGIKTSTKIIKIDAGKPNLDRRFNNALEEIIDERKRLGGNLEDFRERTERLRKSLFGE